MRIIRFVRASSSLIVCAVITIPASAQEKLADWSGVTSYGAYARFGQVVADLGDVDGDGVPDAVIAAPFEETSSGSSPGAIYVISGATGAWLQHDLGSGYATLFGQALCTPGDLDGDGMTDFLVGEPDALNKTNGTVYAYSGASGGLLFQLDGPLRGSFFGFRIGRLGDIDADGIEDFGVGSLYPGSGSVYVYSGANQALLYEFHGSNSGARKYVSQGVGDIDGDGHADFGIGAPIAGPNQQGKFEVYSGATGNLIYRLIGENAHDWFGLYAAQTGDVDLDGHPDLLIAAPVHCIQPNFAEGRVYLYSGATGTLLWSVDGVVYNEQLGFLPTNGDVDFNRDGWPDVVIGTPARNLVHVYSGRNGTLLYDFRGGPDDKTMCMSSRFGDLDGDGFDDLLIGVPDNFRSAPAAGRAYVFGGNDLFLQASQSVYSAGETFSLQTTGGEPYTLTLTVLTGINGTPTFLPVVLGNLDVNGTFTVSGTVPNGSLNLTLSFMAYAVPASGHGVADSIPETVLIQ